MERKRQRCLQAKAQARHGSNGLVRVKLPRGLPCACHPGMRTSGSKARGLWPLTSASGPVAQRRWSLRKLWCDSQAESCPTFAFMPRGSMFDDEDEDLPHEVSEETVVTKNGPS